MKAQSTTFIGSLFVRLIVGVFLCWVVARNLPVRIGGLSFGPQTCKALSRRHLRVGIPPGVGFAGGILVNGGLQPGQSGFSRFFRKPGVDFVIVDEDASKEQALTGCADDENKVDILWSSIGSWAVEFPEYKKAGIKATAIAQIATSDNACALIGNAKVHDVQSYTGKIATAQWSPAHWLTQKLVKNVDSIDLVSSFAEATKKFVKNDVGVVALCEPYLHEALNKPGAHALADGKGSINFILVARKEIIDESTDILRDFVNNWLDGNRLSNATPNIATKSFQDLNIIPRELVEDQIKNTHFYVLEDNEKLFRDNRGPNSFDRQYEDANRIWQRSHLYTTENPENAKDTRLLPQRLAEVSSGGEPR